jgi:hypothetical protein
VPRAAWILLSVALAALVALLTGAAFLIGTSSGTGVDTGTTAGNIASPRLQLPLARDSRALMLASDRPPVLVGLAARPGGPVEVAALDGERELSPAKLSFSVAGRDVPAVSCGYACSRLDAAVLDGTPRIVSIEARGKPTVRFRLPARLPPSAGALFGRVQRTMRSLRSYRYRERLSSGVGRPVVSVFEARAPDRLRLVSSTGGRTIIIGRSRWDRVGGRWARTPFSRLSTSTFMWDGAFNARLVGGRVLTVFDFDPVPAWFRLTIGPDARVLAAEMISPSHFMLQSFSRFNTPISIEPPR